MIVNEIAPGTVMLTTRIPAVGQVAGLEYGAYLSHRGYDCYYVRPIGTEVWGFAKCTPANDELEADVLAAIQAEIGRAMRGTAI